MEAAFKLSHGPFPSSWKCKHNTNEFIRIHAMNGSWGICFSPGSISAMRVPENISSYLQKIDKQFVFLQSSFTFKVYSSTMFAEIPLSHQLLSDPANTRIESCSLPPIHRKLMKETIWGTWQKPAEEISRQLMNNDSNEIRCQNNQFSREAFMAVFRSFIMPTDLCSQLTYEYNSMWLLSV